MPVAGAPQAVIAPLEASVRPPVRKHTTEKLFGTHRSAGDLRRGRILVLARAVAILQRADAVMADGHPQDVRSKRAEGVLAMADGLRVHDPVCGPYVLVDARAERGLLPWIAELRPEDHGERLDMDEERWA